MFVTFDKVAVTGRMIRVAHKLQVVPAIVCFVKIFVMNDCTLSFETWNFTEQAGTNNNPMRSLLTSRIILLHQHITLFINLATERHQRCSRFQLFCFQPRTITQHKFMATLAPGGRISTDIANEEITRLRDTWSAADRRNDEAMLTEFFTPDELQAIDLFDRLQLSAVIRICRTSPTLSEAGRKLFHSSRDRKQTVNDADRLRKYLKRFGLSWQQMNRYQ